MVSHFGTKLLGLSVLGAIALINSGSANAAQNLRYATWDPPHHEWIKFGVDKWIKSIGQVTSGRVNVKKLAKGLGAPPAYHDFIKKGAIDVAHSHPDHHSVAYQKQGRVKMQIGKETFTVEEGDTYFHPMGIVHQHEALEDSVRIETKIFPNGGAVAAWNKLVGIDE